MSLEKVLAEEIKKLVQAEVSQQISNLTSNDVNHIVRELIVHLEDNLNRKIATQVKKHLTEIGEFVQTKCSNGE